MSPQRKEEKIIKVYEILLEGIEKIDSTETKGFNNIDSKEKSTVEIFSVIDEIIKEVQESQMEDVRKDIIVEKLFSLKNKLEI
jgi:hypothetical protein